MFSFYPSHPRALRYSPPVYSVFPDDDSYLSYHLPPRDSPLLVTNPEVRYRRALGEYFAAEEEYNALCRAREEAKLMRTRARAARAEAILRERERLRLAQLVRARREQQARQGLTKALVRAAISGNDDFSLHHFVPVPATVMYQTSEQPLSDMTIPSCMCGHASCADGASVQKEKAQRDGEEEAIVSQCPLSASEPGECECAVPNLESVLRERLQRIAGDEEVHDLARAILRHLSSATGVSPCADSSLPEPDEGAQLSRTHALKGAAAEAAKASFKAHRAEVAEKPEPSPTPRTVSSSLTIIEDIRSALSKLSADFSLPPSLDFSDDEPDGLAYTPINAPVRVYEHALNRLLEQLDAVESDGDEEVRVVRRAAVKEVEKTIEDVEKRIREARERLGGSPGSVVSGGADLTEGKDVDGGVDQSPSSDDDKPEAEEASSNSGDRVDSAPSKPEILPIPNPIMAASEDAKPTDTKPVQGEDIPKDRSSTPVSGSVTPPIPSVPSPATPEFRAERIILAREIVITPPDSPVEVSVPLRGAIAPSSTPIAPLVPSIIPDELPAALSCDEFPNSLGEDDVDDEGEWTEI